MKNDDTHQSEAVAKGIAIYEQGMGGGDHPFTRRLQDFLSPVGNASVVRCLLFGHYWYLGDPVRFGLSGANLPSQQKNMDLTDDLGPWDCFCSRCGAGTRYDEPPEESLEHHDYWCYTCSEVVDGEDIIQHARDDFNRDGWWPTYSNAAVHAPTEEVGDDTSSDY